MSTLPGKGVEYGIIDFFLEGRSDPDEAGDSLHVPQRATVDDVEAFLSNQVILTAKI